MMRSGMAATLRALRYSGCFLKREEFSRVEASSVKLLSASLKNWVLGAVVMIYPCRPARTRAQREG